MVRNLEFTVRSSRPLYRLFLLAACVIVLSGVAGARAAIQFDVFLGYDSLVPEASWFPIVCEIKNDGPPFKGRIEVSEGRFDQGQSRYAEVELPTTTLKRVVIPVFSAARNMRSWDVRLLDERGKVRAEQLNVPSRKELPAGTPILGALTRTMTSVPTIAAPQNHDLQPLAARILPDLLPDNPLVLEGLNAIYLSSEKAPLLNDGQARAVLAWLQAGGHLIVGVEQTTDLDATRWLNSVLPFMPREMKPLAQHRELQEWLRSATWRTNVALAESFVPSPGPYNRRNGPRRSGPNPAPAQNAAASNPFGDLADDFNFEASEMLVASGKLLDGQVVVAAGDTPLIVSANRGRGRVTMLLFSPEREPVKSWKNQPTFWAKLLDVPGAWYVSGANTPMGGQASDGIFKAMIDTRQIHQLPVAWLLLLLIVYLVVIGPLDQFWLKRIGRPMLTWITFPCYVVAFSLIIYLIGYKLRAGESEWNELHLVDLLGTSEHAELRGRTFMSVYSPANQRYPLASPQQIAAFRSEFAAGWNGKQANEKATVLQNGDSFRAEIFVPVWTSQLFVSDWWQATAAPLTAAVTAKDDGWEVRVDNHTDHELTNAKLAVEDRMLSLGDVPAGATKSFTVSRSQSLPLSEFVQSHAQGFYQAVQQHSAAFGNTQGGWIGDLPNNTVAASFLSRLEQSQNFNYYSRFVGPPGLDMSSVVDHGEAVLFAWAGDYAPVKTIRQFNPKRSHRDTLFRVTLPVK